MTTRHGLTDTIAYFNRTTRSCLVNENLIQQQVGSHLQMVGQDFNHPIDVARSRGTSPQETCIINELKGYR